MDFKYAPGLPGYGTRGVDGSSGMSGIASYFSDLNGATDKSSIRDKISLNKELFQNSLDYLPGYPVRVYQTGDIFIDKDAQVYQIDLDEADLFKATGTGLNTSGSFESGPEQSVGPEFDRYTNKFSSEKILIDNVYAATLTNGYYNNPSPIYGTTPLYYGQISYVGADIVGSIQTVSPGLDFYPYHVWTNDKVGEDEGIALVKELSNNVWHIGNKNGGSIRDVYLDLDFQTIGIASEIHSNSADLILKSEDIEDGDAYDVYIQSGSITGGTTTSYDGGSIFIESGGGAARSSGTGTDAGVGGGIDITAGDGGETSWLIAKGGEGGPISLSAGDGGESTSSDAGMLGGDGGEITLNGGDGNDGGLEDGVGGTGGKVRIYGGDGGDGEECGGGGDVGIYGGDSGSNSAYTGSAKSGKITLLGGKDEKDDRELVFAGCTTTGVTLNGGLAIGTGDYDVPSLVFAGDTFKTLGFYKGDTDTISMTFDGTEETSLHFTGDSNTWGGYSEITSKGALKIRGGGIDEGGDGGELQLYSGDSDEQGGGTIGIYAGDGAADGGDIRIYAGDGDASQGGNIKIISGSASLSTMDSKAGDITIQGGVGHSSDGYPFGGNIILKSGRNEDTGVWTDSGDITFDVTAYASGSPGKLKIDGVPLRVYDTTDYRRLMVCVSTGSVDYKRVLLDNLTSDRRLKEVIKPLENSRDKLGTLSTVYFKWNQHCKDNVSAVTNDRLQLGVIAQEVEEVYPEIVSQFEGEDGSLYKAVDYEKFTTILIGAIKDHNKEIDGLKDMIDKQQEQINVLMNK